MRFSSIFQLPLTPRSLAQLRAARRIEEPSSTYPGMESLPPTDFSRLPEELDQRVRLVGEWQLGMD
jgi:hypothetical protein